MIIKKIISWDIGINNLAYCILTQEGDIIEWDVVDILRDIRKKTYICEMIMKNNKECGKKASFIKDDKYYCGMHGKGYDKIIEYSECMENNKNGKKCSSKAQFYKDDIYYCNKHSNGKDGLNKYITEDNISFYDRCRLLYKTLDELDELKNIQDVDIVLIENQPVFKNPIMKSLQMLIYGYYLKLGKEIFLINAKNKLKIYDGPKIECQIKDIHAKNKYLGKEYCRYYLKDNEEKLVYFESFPKKDDLADTYLQGLYYLKNC